MESIVVLVAVFVAGGYFLKRVFAQVGCLGSNTNMGHCGNCQNCKE